LGPSRARRRASPLASTPWRPPTGRIANSTTEAPFRGKELSDAPHRILVLLLMNRASGGQVGEGQHLVQVVDARSQPADDTRRGRNALTCGAVSRIVRWPIRPDAACFRIPAALPVSSCTCFTAASCPCVSSGILPVPRMRDTAVTRRGPNSSKERCGTDGTRKPEPAAMPAGHRWPRVGGAASQVNPCDCRARGNSTRVRCSHETIRGVLRRHGVPPAPHRARTTWRQFLWQHAPQMLATDFLTIHTVWLQRLCRLIHLPFLAPGRNGVGSS